MEPKKLVGGLLLGVAALWIIGWASSRSYKADAPQVVQASPTDKWQVSEEKSPMDDSKTVMLALDSGDEIHGPLGAVKPSLVIRCKEKKTSVYVMTGMAASVEEDLNGGPKVSHTVRLRLDDEPAIAQSWSESTAHDSLFASDVIWGEQWDSLLGMTVPTVVSYSGGVVELAKKLAEAGTLTFQFTPFGGSPQVARFELKGLDNYLHKVAEACGWAY